MEEYFSFCRGLQLTSFRLPSIKQFVAKLHLDGRAHSTICSYISAMKFHCKRFDIVNDLDSPQLALVLRGARNFSEGAHSSPRVVCTILQLERMVTLASTRYNSYERSLVTCMFTLAFFGFLRVSEYAVSSAGHTIRREDCSITCDALVIIIRTSKTSREGVAIKLPKRKDYPAVCPAAAFSAYIKVRPRTSNSPLFLMPSWAPVRTVDVSRYVANLSSLAGLGELTTHSFRIGGASWAAGQGWSDAAIRAHGRWHSNAFLSYVRPL